MAFHKINMETWERKEIYPLFEGFIFTITVQMDITELYHQIKKRNRKFYPTICWIITKTVNQDKDFRYGKMNGEVGYYDECKSNYTLRRKSNPSLFTHMTTEYNSDYEVYYEQFVKDQALCEEIDRLYYYDEPLPGSVDISITPTLQFQSISMTLPPGFYERSAGNEGYSPFITVGKFYKEGDRVMIPVCGQFKHAVNDGYHAEKFFRLFQENLTIGVAFSGKNVEIVKG